MSDIVTLNGYKIKDEKAVRSYDTIALMKADTKLKEGYHVKTKGYYEANDGGSAEYVIVDDETLVDDGGSIHVLTNGLRAKLIINDNINAKQLGAYGDDIHDDLIPLQNLINLINLSSKYDINIPRGTYLISDTLIISDISNININAINSIIHYTGNNYAIKITKAQNSSFNFGEINSPNGSCIKLESLESKTWCQYLNINFNILNSLNNCIHAYCELGWLNEIRVNKGRLQSGTNGILLENNRDANSMSSWTLNELGFEGITNAINLTATQGTISQIRAENCRYAELITYGAKLLNCSGICKRIRIKGDVNIQSALISVTSDTEDLFLEAPCVYYSTTYLHGGYYKNNIFIPNNSNLFQLIDGNIVTEETDLNNIVNPGCYLFSATKITGMSHTPVSSENTRPARMIVIGTYSSIYSPQSPNSRAMQMLFNGAHIYIRSFSKSSNSYSFDVWYEVDKTQVVI